jgi:nucleotide-binding universal stress UspA family protein
MKAPKVILCATDFGPSSTLAVKLALSIAQSFDGSLTLVHVFDAPIHRGPPFVPLVDDGVDAQAHVSVQLEAAVASAKTTFERVKGVLRRGRPWEEIIGLASEMGADLVVLGTHGRRGLPRAILGSVAEKVVRLSPRPVLTVPSTSAEAAEAT